MKIGIDIDEVLANTMSNFLDFHNEMYGTDATRDEITDYYFDGLFHWTREENFKRFDEFYKTRFFEDIVPVEGAADGIKSLQQLGTLYVITSRPLYIKEQTLKWLTRYFGDDLPEVYFAHLDGAGTKADLCDQLGIDLLIEDSLEFAEACAAKNVQVLLMDAPWNRRELADNITRVYNWDEILTKVATIHA
jgi:uncharacterized HAD superfamily protein